MAVTTAYTKNLTLPVSEDVSDEALACGTAEAAGGAEAAGSEASSGATAAGDAAATDAEAGSVQVLGKAKQTEIDYANELADEGHTVQVRGTDAPGGDLVVDGVTWELKTLNSATQTAVMGNVERGLVQGEGRVIVDGRSAGLSAEDARQALARLEGKGSLANAKQIIIDTVSGRITWP